MDDKLRGVNLGGWLILERWMTPSVFAGTDARDEYHFMQTPNARAKITAHRETFITEVDFAWLEKHNVNAVRIPVGYWVLTDDLPYISAGARLDWVFAMAQKYSMCVVLDVHGLPGSQNGRDHSGHADSARWLRRKKHRTQSLRALEALAKRYKDHPQLWGIQIINEPKFGPFQRKVRHYYRQAYDTLSQILRPHTRIIFSDAFTPRLLSGALKDRAHEVVMDVHSYHMTTPFAHYFSLEWFFGKLRRRQRVLEELSREQPIIIGEWSGVLRGETMRHIPRQQHTDLLRRYIQLQLAIYDNLAGWFYWSYKTESADEWNFRSQVEAGIIELPPNP